MISKANTFSVGRPGGSSALAWGLLLALFAISPTGALPQSGAANTNPNSLVPPNFSVLTAKWWKWALETPTPSNPFIDTSGINCAVGQSGSVWFLAGGLFGAGNITRQCTIPAGKILLIPVANTVYIPFKTDPIRNAIFSGMNATGFIDSATNLNAQIDGVPVSNLSDYRVKAKAFAIVLPADNIVGLPPLPAGPYAPSAADGYYLPIVLSAGLHTIHVHGEFPDGMGGIVVEDATADLTVL
jgi:hypothetical protein